MADKVVSLKVLVDTKSGQVNVEELDNDIKKTIKDTETLGTDTQKTTNKMSSGFQKVGDTVSQVNPALGGMVSGIQSSTKAALAFIATPFGAALAAIGVALGALVTFFKRTERGADFFEEKLSAIKATINVLIDRFAAFGEGILQIFTGEFSKGVDTLTKSFKGIGDEISRESKEAMSLTRALDDLEDKEIALIEVNERKKTQIAELRLLASDEDVAKEKRLKALQQAAQLENEIADAEIAIAKEKARIITAQVAMGESLASDLREQAEANALVIRLEGDRAMSLRALNKEMKRLRTTESETKETDEAHKTRVLRLQELKAEIQSITTQEPVKQLELLNATFVKLEKTLAWSPSTDFGKFSKVIQDELQIIGDSINAISELYATFESDNDKRNRRIFAINKALNIAVALIDTYMAAQKAYASQMTLDPSAPIRAQIAAGVAIVSGLARVNAIRNTKYGDTSAKSTTTGGGSTSVSGSTSNRVDAELTPITAQSIRRTRKMDTVRVVVVESDIRETTDRIDSIMTKAVVQ